MTTYSTPDKFQQPLLRYIGDGQFFLQEDYVFEWVKGPIYRRITILAGMEYDKASVPKPFWGLGFTRDGECEAAALIHDVLCRQQYIPKSTGSYQRRVYSPDLKQEWVVDTSKWDAGEIHELYRWMCTLGGMPRWKAGIQKTALTVWPPLAWRLR